MNVLKQITSAILSAILIAVPTLAQDAKPQPKLTLISNVNIFDGVSDQLQRNMHVLVKDNLIEAISKDGKVYKNTLGR